jgi:hypothetical protein
MSQTRKKVKLPKLQVRASFVPTSINEESGTIDVTWTTGHKGLRRTLFGEYFEELSLREGDVNMSHLKSGRAKFLASHDIGSLDSVLGVIEQADIGSAKIRFSKDEISQRNLQKIRDGILTDVSVGYLVEEYTDVSKEGDEIPTYRATKWQPIEISLVPVGFDPGAVVRTSETQNENEVEIITRSKEQEETPAMDEIEKEKARQAELAAAAQKKADEAAAAERTRAQEILKLVRAAGAKEEMADAYIARGTSVEEVRTNLELFAKFAKEQEATRVQPTVTVEIGQTSQEKKRSGFEEALLNRVDSKTFKVTDAAKIFAGKSALRMVEEYIGRNIGETDAQLAKRAMSSSDLPLILANIAEKSAQKRYELQPRTYEKWAKKDTLRNYKQASQVRAGDFASLLERKESGEYLEGSIGEEKEVAQLKDYGIRHAFSNQMLVNDDLSLIMKVANESGIAAARLENKLAYAALTGNPTMNDGIALFHASHANLGSAAVVGSASFTEAFKFMRKQKSVSGLDPLNLTPRYLLCSPDKEAEARQFLAQIVPNQTSSVNIYVGAVELIVDAELTGNAHYFMADPALIDTVTVFNLEGQESPKVETRYNWKTDALEIKVGHTVTAAPMDWRGMVKNPGA